MIREKLRLGVFCLMLFCFLANSVVAWSGKNGYDDYLYGKAFTLSIPHKRVYTGASSCQIVLLSLVDNEVEIRRVSKSLVSTPDKHDEPNEIYALRANLPMVVNILEDGNAKDILIHAHSDIYVQTSCGVSIITRNTDIQHTYNKVATFLSYDNPSFALLSEPPIVDTIIYLCSTSYNPPTFNIKHYDGEYGEYNQTYGPYYGDTELDIPQYGYSSETLRVYHVTLKVFLPEFKETKSERFCGNGYNWRNDHTFVTLKESGTYTDCHNDEHYDQNDFCKKCKQLNLELLPIPIKDIDTTACLFKYIKRGNYRKGQTIEYKYDPNPKLYPIKIDTIEAKNGECDTIVELTLRSDKKIDTINYTICHNVDRFTNCDGNSMTILEGTKILPPCTLTTKAGCDSIVYFRITRPKRKVTRDTVEVCPEEMGFDWDGQWVAKGSTASKTFKDVQGCDSIVELHVKPYSMVCPEDSATVCYGSSYTWHNKKLTLTPPSMKKTFYDTLSSVVHGCDSICSFILRMLPEIAATEYGHVCLPNEYTDGKEFVWEGHYDKKGQLRRYDKPGTYYDTLRYSSGTCTSCDTCDSIIRLVVTGHYPHLDTLVTYGCVTQNFILPNGETISSRRDTQFVRWYPQTGIPGIIDTAIDDFGCYKGMYVDIHVVKYIHPKDPFGDPYRDTAVLVKTKSHLETEVSSIDWGGIHIDEEGEYCHIFQSVNGCDSAVCLYVKEIRDVDTVLVVHRCAGENYRWNNKTYKIPNKIKRDTSIIDSVHTTVIVDNLYEKDSLCVLYLIGHPAYNTQNGTVVQKRDTLCMGDTIYQNGKQITTGGRFIFFLETVNGCDSTVNYHVDQYSKFDTTIIDSMCWSQTYTDFGLNIDTFGDFTFSYLNRYGCDSIYHVHISEIVDEVYVVDTACADEPYLFNDNILWASGYYTDTLYLECKTIYHLYLTIISVAQLSIMDIEECADEPILNLPFEYTSVVRPSEYSIYVSDSALRVGFKHIIHKRLYGDETFLELPTPLYQEKGKYVQPDMYTGIVHVWNEFCDSVSTSFKISLRYPTSVLQQMWNDMLLVKDFDYNGGYEFTNFVWYCDGREITDYHEKYLYYTHDLALGESYVVYLTRMSDGRTIATCPYIAEDKVDWVLPKAPYITVNPTWVTKRNPVISVTTNTGGEYSIYTMDGKRVGGGSFVPCEHNQLNITLPTSFPICLIYFQANDGTKQFEKIYIH